MGAESLPLQHALVFAPVFYFSVAYSITKHDLFHIDRFVRQGAIYSVLTAVTLVAYLIAVVLPSRMIPSFAPRRGLLTIILAIVLTLALNQARRAVQRLIDRAFFRERLSFRETLTGLSKAMTSLLELDEIGSQVTELLTSSMHLESARLAVLDVKRPRLWSRAAGGDLRREEWDERLNGLARVIGSDSRSPDPLSVLGRLEVAEDRAALGAQFEASGIQAVIPLVFGERPIGVFLLGGKRSGRPFTPYDLNLLRTLANQTAIALQNARAYGDLQELKDSLDHKVKEQALRLAQAEKMAALGQLVAGVAHELNNPASFVSAGMANLKEYVEAFVAAIQTYEERLACDPAGTQLIQAMHQRNQLDFLLESTPKLLNRSAEGAERITRIVNNLRVFVRADQGDRAPTDLREGIESTLEILAGPLRNSGARVVPEYQPVPRVLASAGLLNQVWMNLISNAIDAVERHPNPTIRVSVKQVVENGASEATSAPGAKGWIEVSVTDNGAGIPDHIQPRIFEPFFTTKPLGRGMGLGLSLAFGAVRSHSGTISAVSEPGRGTTMTVRLPVS